MGNHLAYNGEKDENAQLPLLKLSIGPQIIHSALCGDGSGG